MVDFLIPIFENILKRAITRETERRLVNWLPRQPGTRKGWINKFYPSNSTMNITNQDYEKIQKIAFNMPPYGKGRGGRSYYGRGGRSSYGRGRGSYRKKWVPYHIYKKRRGGYRKKSKYARFSKYY